MDSITHTLFGIALYGAVNKENAEPALKRSLFFAAVVGSHIPDSDVVVSLTETGRVMEQMWHRGITHSFAMTFVWALLLWGICRWIWKVKDVRIFRIALGAVFIHIISDAMNGWGTGLFEPFSSVRIALGTIPIADAVILLLLVLGGIAARWIRKWPSHRVYQAVWLLIAVHVALQNIQGLIIQKEYNAQYEQVALIAEFVPWHFQVVGKTGHKVEIWETSLWRKPQLKYTLYSAENAELEPLFAHNPKAEVLYEWSPFVVIVDDEERLGIYDPRFYRNGSSFLYEYVNKESL